jgi:hypothetical protein
MINGISDMASEGTNRYDDGPSNSARSLGISLRCERAMVRVELTNGNTSKQLAAGHALSERAHQTRTIAGAIDILEFIE